MALSFEARLEEVSSPEIVKSAKQLLKNGKLTGAWRDDAGRIHAIFQNHEQNIHVIVTTGEPPAGECGCGRCGKRLCEHAVATILYGGRFRAVPAPPAPDGNANYYGGLKFESWETLAENQAANQPVAELWIMAESAFPHLPSKWENAVLSVKLKVGSREYLGNVSNLRSLYFDKSLAVNVKLLQFSLQDRQIIRYLAINAEPDNSKLTLNSEQTAEFFHCLVGFERFYRDGRRVLVHCDHAEPVIMVTGKGAKRVYSPGVRVDGALLAIESAKVITGRSGCWVGKAGEYWWMPATLDVGWLRNFFRTGEYHLTEVPDSTPIPERLPIEICEVGSLELQAPQAKVLLQGELLENGSLRVRPEFSYDGRLVAGDQARLGRAGGRFFARDEKFEQAFLQELTMFGAVPEAGWYLLAAPETAGAFIEYFMAEKIRAGRVYPDPVLSRLSRGGTGMAPVELAVKVAAEETDRVVLEYAFAVAGEPVAFAGLAAVLKNAGHYIATPGRNAGVIPPALAVLLNSGVLRENDEFAHRWNLPRYSVPYYLYLAASIPGAIPAALYRFDPSVMPPAPFADRDEAPSRFVGTLRGYQREGVQWLAQRLDLGFNVILADEMGLGKTVQVLALLSERKRKSDLPAVIIAPASLVENWRREAARFVPDFRVGMLHGGDRDAVWAKANDYDLLLLSYATARRDEAELKKRRFSYLILDEAQHIKNPGTANAHSCKAIKARHRLVLTGTPLENSAEDLWSIFDFLHPGILGSLASFRRRYEHLSEHRELQDELAGRVAPFIKRRTKALVAAELPPKTEVLLFSEMDEAQRKLYNQVLNRARTELAKAEKSTDKQARLTIFTELLRLRQVCCHPELLPDQAGSSVASAKMELLKELIMENIDSGHRMLLFSQFTSLLAIIREYLDATGIPYEYLDGTTRNRLEHVDAFNNNPNIPIFLLSIKAGGTGLNLTSADTVIIYDPWWNPAVEMQATDRTHRIGQTKPVTSLKLLVKDSVEERILDLQGRKQEIFDGLIDNPAAGADALSMDDLKYLLQ